uniref:Uncharacterized protein n=1 Tax=Anolis carolinensis TaxID=28377 RepID=A0A803TL22_ANOCA
MRKKNKHTVRDVRDIFGINDTSVSRRISVFQIFALLLIMHVCLLSLNATEYDIILGQF